MTQTLPLALAHSGPMPSLTLEVGGDEALVRSVVGDGSDAAFRELYQRHTGRLYRIALRMTSSEADAEDAVQETWLRAMQGMPTFEWRSALSTWLAGVVINVVHEQLQRRGRWKMVDLVIVEYGVSFIEWSGIASISGVRETWLGNAERSSELAADTPPVE